MKTCTIPGFARCLTLLFVVTTPAFGQFNSGSNGSDGAINITTNTTLAVPADGIFHFTTVNVATGSTLSFTPNALNTPVYMLATGNVTIAGTVHVDGKPAVGSVPGEGGPGGFRGGFGNVASLPGGHGLGPGGSAYNGGGNALFYGNYGNAACIPLVGGSGGGAYYQYGGGGGGGAILIASNTQIQITGLVASRPGGGTGYDGSGGAIRLVSPVITGTGNVTTTSTGRIRVDTEDRIAWRTLIYSNIPGFSYGTRMAVFPAPVPRIDITEAGGTTITEGAAGPVLVQLTPGAPTSQNVKVKVSNLTGAIDIVVAVVPENAPRTLVTTPVDMGGGGTPVEITVPVTIPVGMRSAIEAYKK